MKWIETYDCNIYNVDQFINFERREDGIGGWTEDGNYIEISINNAGNEFYGEKNDNYVDYERLFKFLNSNKVMISFNYDRLKKDELS